MDWIRCRKNETNIFSVDDREGQEAQGYGVVLYTAAACNVDKWIRSAAALRVLKKEFRRKAGKRRKRL